MLLQKRKYVSREIHGKIIITFVRMTNSATYLAASVIEIRPEHTETFFTVPYVRKYTSPYIDAVFHPPRPSTL